MTGIQYKQKNRLRQGGFSENIPQWGVKQPLLFQVGDAIFIPGGFMHHLHEHVFDAAGIGHLMKDESFLFPGSLDEDVPEIEDARDDADDFAGNILDFGEVEFADFTYEQTPLLYIDNPLIGDDPDVKPVIDPDEKCEEPSKYNESAAKKTDECRIDG